MVTFNAERISDRSKDNTTHVEMGCITHHDGNDKYLLFSFSFIFYPCRKSTTSLTADTLRSFTRATHIFYNGKIRLVVVRIYTEYDVKDLKHDFSVPTLSND